MSDASKYPEPPGVRFVDLRSGREMILVDHGPWAGWIVYRHPEGRWVSLREATRADRDALADAPTALVLRTP